MLSSTRTTGFVVAEVVAAEGLAATGCPSGCTQGFAPVVCGCVVLDTETGGDGSIGGAGRFSTGGDEA